MKWKNGERWVLSPRKLEWMLVGLQRPKEVKTIIKGRPQRLGK